MNAQWALRLPDDAEALALERTRLQQTPAPFHYGVGRPAPPGPPPRCTPSVLPPSKAGSAGHAQKPRIFDLEDVRRRTAAQKLLQDSTFVENDNAAGLMVLRSIVNSALQATAVLGSYFFIESGGRILTPQCFKLHVSDVEWKSEQMLPEYTCFVASYCFWTFPVTCAFGVVVIFLKSLLDKRLFYECLLNRIFLVQSKASYLRSPTIWFLFLYGATGMSCVYFVDWDAPIIKKHDVDVVFGLLVYLSSTCAFVFVICSQWSSSRSILPLPTFVQQDCAAAVQLLSECQFVHENDFRRAFEVIEEVIESENAKYNTILKKANFSCSFDLRTAELMRLILDAHEQHSEPPSFCSQMYYHMRLGQVYWVTRVLFFPHLHDTRSGWFKFWARFHYVFTTFAALLFMYTLFYLTNEFLVFQKAISPVIHAPSPESDIQDIVNKTITAGTAKLRDIVDRSSWES